MWAPRMFMPSVRGFSPIWNMAMDLFMQTLYTLSPFCSFPPSAITLSSSRYPSVSMVFTMVSMHSRSVLPLSRNSLYS